METLFWKAFFGLLAFDLFGLGRNFARLHRTVQNWPVAKKTASPDPARVCHAVNCASVWYPKHVLCLQRSVVTTCLLRACGLSARMVLGAQKLPLKAHAWVELGGSAINERSDARRKYGVWEQC